MRANYNEADIMVIFSGSPFDASIVKEILVDHGINAFTRNELMGTIAPWHVSAGGIDPVEVEILKKEALSKNEWVVCIYVSL